MLLCDDGVGNPQWLKTEHDQPSPAAPGPYQQGACDSSQDQEPASHHECVLASRVLASTVDHQESAEKQADQEHQEDLAGRVLYPEDFLCCLLDLVHNTWA